MHRKRVLTGISMAFIIVMSFLFLPLNILTPVVSIVVSLSAWEFLRLRFTSEISVLISLILFFCLIYLSFGIGFKLTIISSGLLFWLLLSFLIIGFPHNKSILQNNYFWLISAFFMHIPFWTSIFLIISYEGNFMKGFGLSIDSRNTLVLLISVSAVMDILAYYGGKKYGKNKFLSNVSPNKTLEGFLIGIFGTPLVILPILAIFTEFSFLKVLFLLFFVLLFSALGDATASLFKRVVGVKDSSKLIPGHGGILDRIDSHLAAAPCFVVMVYLLGGSA